MKIWISPVGIQLFQQSWVCIWNAITELDQFSCVCKLIIKFEVIDFFAQVILLVQLTRPIPHITTALRPGSFLIDANVRLHSSLVERFWFAQVDKPENVPAWLVTFYSVYLLSAVLKVVIVAMSFCVWVNSSYEPIFVILKIDCIQIASFEAGVKD